ncbi:tRNA (guanine-N(7)-)-methyltransferase non-catalytic subunit WDR4 [Petromyzon marinus]|uniref:tRNA (guanine-N(7)-)-methyltransferase non-catalytic subunit WDR4 n=1 Tax=Petromyzon marinus TaxID=7757 RepID=UPI003F71A8A0
MTSSARRRVIPTLVTSFHAMASLCAGVRDSRVLVCAGARALLLAPPLGEGEARVLEFDTRSDTQGQAPGTVSAGAQGLILAACISSSGDLIAIADDFKRLSVFRVRSSWERLFSCSVPRCCTALALVPDGPPAPNGENGGARDTAGAGAIVLAADRAGDVYRFRVPPGSPAQILEEAVNGQPLLGHLSMLLDLAVTEDARFVVTSDRDEKVRVSLLDAPHNIHTFCLGHTAFVSRVTLMKNHPDKLLTGSGDGTVRLWDLTSGREISSCNLNPSPAEQRKEHPVSCVAHTATLDMIAAVCEGLPGVHLLHLVNCDEEGRDPTMHRLGEMLAPDWPVLSASFDGQSRLWLLGGRPCLCVRVYATRHEGKFELLPLSEAESLSRSLAQMPEELPGSAWSSFSALYRHPIDGSEVYFQRKEERLEKRKRKH